MGWDTEIIIIAQNIDTRNDAHNIAKQIFELDSKSYGRESIYVIEDAHYFSLYYHYVRRTHAPYWVIEDISKNFTEVNFTILGEMMQFVCGGPSCVIRINSGKILDSYGIEASDIIRRRILDKPILNRESIYGWFKCGGKEQELRNDYSYMYPISSCGSEYLEKLIPINNNDLESRLEEQHYMENSSTWEMQPSFRE